MGKRFALLSASLAACCAIVIVVSHSAWGRVLDVVLTDRARPASLTGAVRSLDGQPIGAALVCASCSSCAARDEPPMVCATTRRDGRYELSAVEDGRYFLTALADGYAAGAPRETTGLLLMKGRSQEAPGIALAKGGVRVAGSVRGADGAAIANARVRITRYESPRLAFQLASDARGAFSASLPEGQLAIRAHAAGHAPAQLYGVAPEAHADLTLQPAFELRGSVVRAASGDALANVELRAVSHELIPRVARTKSDARGRFAFSDLGAGRYIVAASGAGAYGELPGVLELGAHAGHADPILIEAHPAFELRGRVQVDTQAPCAEGYVLLGEPDPAQPRVADLEEPAASAEGFGPEQYAAIAHDGGVHFGGVPPGRYFASVYCRDHVLQRGPQRLELPRDAQRELLWTMQPATRLTVRVVDRRGAPVAGARIAYSWPAYDGRRVLSPALTGEDGRAELAGAVCGDCRVMPADDLDAASAVAFELSADGRRGQATLVLEGDATLELQVRDGRGAPVDRLQVFARNAGSPDGKRVATARGDGRYRFAALAAGAYVVFSDDGVKPTQLLWGSDIAPIELEPGATLRAQSVLALD